HFGLGGGVIDGLVVVEKPAGWTSHDVVARCRKVYGQKRVGHSGTLDPDATGVLLVGLGRVTRLLRFLTDLRKTYAGEVVLGTATSTLDSSGDVVGTWDMGGVGLADVQAAAEAFVGAIQQIPPMVSAVKIGGKRLHELARAGEEVERPPRPVTVYRLDVSAGREPGVFAIEVECSSGTYIRTLAADIGTALGGGAHLRNLRRTAIGSFTTADAHPLESLDLTHVLPAAEAMRDYPSATVAAAAADDVAHGRAVEPHTDGPWAVIGPAGDLLAVYEGARPAVVLPLDEGQGGGGVGSISG
ncbi:MAG: tRNA pseudouridine55 synthase, partial [Acidimicrobiaceae bacterium]|nr:tRNA pseudouridine55 synthase [Acidimicrobiaceae bacterium]